MQIIVNGQKIKIDENKNALDALREAGFEIPSLCYHSDLTAKSSCRLCLISIKGVKGLQTACSVKLSPNMEITTESPEITKARKINLELLFSQRYLSPELLKLAKQYKANLKRYVDRKKVFPKYQFGPAVLFDTSKCIDCRNCVEACQKQAVDFLELEQKNTFWQVVPAQNPKTDCVYCGQCVAHCPVEALTAVSETLAVEKAINDENKIVVFQFAPSIRTSIGEEFGLSGGEILTDQIVAGLKKIGANKVFDTSVGADFTSTEEAKELLEKYPKARALV
jgi:NADH-quinone oxidoreductase subunit G